MRITVVSLSVALLVAYASAAALGADFDASAAAVAAASIQDNNSIDIKSTLTNAATTADVKISDNASKQQAEAAAKDTPVEENEKEDPTEESNNTALKNDENKAAADAKADVKEKGILESFLENYIGIDINKEDDSDNDDDGQIEDDLPLKGEEGYVPRPLPAASCPPLDDWSQQIWDVQGNSGKKVTPPTTQTAGDQPSTEQSSTAASDATNDKQEVETAASILKFFANAKKQLTSAISEGKIDEETIKQEATAGLKDLTSKDEGKSKLQDAVDAVEDAQDALHSKGFSICLLGPCESKDEDPEGQEARRKLRAHRRKLNKLRRHPLDIDANTGCPIPAK
ncbi:hypothetical protein BGW41_007794 [Actinomortierella wolfii]|nr:hypothetical protein BGW41_007794 [Actinomortierella wolfii]